VDRRQALSQRDVEPTGSETARGAGSPPPEAGADTLLFDLEDSVAPDAIVLEGLGILEESLAELVSGCVVSYRVDRLGDLGRSS
jgi:citrate lyase beta subunit